MKLPEKLFIDSLAEGKIYYFTSSKLQSDIPHHFICVKRTADDVMIMACCTSQFEKVSKFIETKGLPYETLVRIKPDSTSEDNPFIKDTYVNCNDPKYFTIEELKKLNENGEIRLSGEISAVHYEQIIIGLHQSPMVDEETKDLLPKPEK